MDEETGGLHIIFICILACTLFLTYSAIPSDLSNEKPVRVLSKIQQKTVPAVEQRDAAIDVSSEESETDHNISDEKTVPGDESMEQTVTRLPSGTKDDVHSRGIAVIPMNHPAYKSHKKGIVEFTHQKHVDEYKIDCGQCHHDKNGKPLHLTYEDQVQSCIDCHPETEKLKDEKLDDKQKIAKYHFEALHANCIGCHKTFNIENGDPKGKGPAPVSCAKCHPKK